MSRILCGICRRGLFNGRARVAAVPGIGRRGGGRGRGGVICRVIARDRRGSRRSVLSEFASGGTLHCGLRWKCRRAGHGRFVDRRSRGNRPVGLGRRFGRGSGWDGRWNGLCGCVRGFRRHGLGRNRCDDRRAWPGKKRNVDDTERLCSTDRRNGHRCSDENLRWHHGEHCSSAFRDRPGPPLRCLEGSGAG